MNRDLLMPVLTTVGGVVERRQTLPILGNFLLSANDGILEITGTDLEVEIRAKSSVTIEKSGKVTLPAKKLIDICRSLPEGTELSLKVEQERALLVAGRSRFTLSTLPAVDFPSATGIGDVTNIRVEQSTLKHLLEKTAFAMAHQDVRYYLNGLLLEIKPDRMVAVATDGHRLAKVEVELSLEVGSEIQIIVPRKTVVELNRLLVSETDAVVDLSFSEKICRVIVGDTVLTSKLIDGRYPDYERVIPHMCERVAIVDRLSLKQALLRTSILSNEKFKGIKIQLAKGQLRLQAHNPEKEEAEDELKVEYSQEPAVMGFNVGYLVDVLNTLEEDDVEIGFTDANSSAILRNKGKDLETFVVMPMRL